MKKALLFIYSLIVGFPFGYSGEGNMQWYNFIALVIGGFATFSVHPNFLVVYTILVSIHLLAVFVYDYFNLEASLIGYSFGYVILHIMLFGICFFFYWKWALLLLSLNIFAFLSGSNSNGESVIVHGPPLFSVTDEESNNYKVIIPLLYFFHTLWFGFLTLVVYRSPISLKARIGIIIACIILHPIIDLLQGDSHNGTECFILSLEQIKLHLKKQRTEELI